MEAHQKNSSANGKILHYISETYRYPRDFEALLTISQLLQAEGCAAPWSICGAAAGAAWAR